jgi:hypothetical protein
MKMESFRKDDQERMSPTEAEAVLKRFRDEEELRQREMEAQATNPTVADLAEGLGVPPERIASLLSQVRGGAPAPFQGGMTVQDAQIEVKRANQSAWLIAFVILGAVLVLGILATVFMSSATTIERPAPTIETPTPPVSSAPFESTGPLDAPAPSR